MHPHLHRIALCLCAILLAGSPLAAVAQGSEPQAPPPKPAASTIDPATSLIDAEDFFENDYLRVYVNKRGQFMIVALEGNPKSEIPLLYPSTLGHPKVWSSYAKLRYRYLGTPSDRRQRGDWHVFRTSDTAPMEQRFVDKTGKRAQIVYSLPLPDELIDANGKTMLSSLPMCGMFVTQSISFMTNPFTGRADMVRIRYTIEHGKAYSIRLCNTENNTLGNVEFGLRLLLDTQMGAEDEVSAFLPGLGDASTPSLRTGVAVPDHVRLFGSKSLVSTDRQVMIDLSAASAAAQRVNGPRVAVSAGDWNRYFSDAWDAYAGAETYTDSAVAIRWDGMVDPWSEVFEIGYGLAPAGGGESWIDAPVVLHNTNTMRAYAVAGNQSTNTLRNGTVTLTLPQSMTVPIAVNATEAEDGTWQMPLGDLEPGHAVEAAWDVAIDGPPARYVYTTTTRFDGRPLSIVTNAVDLQQSFGFSQLHTIVSEGSPTTGLGSHTEEVEVRRYNPAGTSTVTFTAADDAGNFNAAIADSDYLTTTKVLTFLGGEITKTVSITIFDDSLAEPNESVLLTLSKPGTNAVILDQGKALLTIVDNDEPLYTNFLNLPALARR